MLLQSNFRKLDNWYKRNSARFVFRKKRTIHTERPLISFTFDDFPKSALLAGGSILEHFGLRGTYYVSLGLLGHDSPSGLLCTVDDLEALRAQGHELGCHTFPHCHSWNTEASAFKASIIQNRDTLAELLPGSEFKSLSYPISDPRPMTKRLAGGYFRCCRAGGQRVNSGTVDLNQLSAFFLEKIRHSVAAVEKVIDANRSACGWLIFATHDVAMSPSPYGVPPDFFEHVVGYAVKSGAQILPVVEALDVLECKSSREEATATRHSLNA